jgi:hypothetical protein
MMWWGDGREEGRKIVADGFIKDEGVLGWTVAALVRV